MDFIKSPKAIEDKSMDLINPFIMDIDLTPEEVTVYSRMIHASGDVDYGHLIQTSKGAVAAGIEALAKGCNIYTDVNMVKAGINKNALHALGSEVFCRVSDPEIATIAKEKGIARSMAAMNSAEALLLAAPSSMVSSHFWPAALMASSVYSTAIS